MADCAASQHGDHNAYRRGCRCPEAREDRRLYYKRWHEGRLEPGMVSSVGAVRRLQALAALGWSPTELAERMGTTRDNVQQIRRGRQETMTRQVHERVAALYEELQGTPGASESTRRWAQRSGWAPPLAWADDAIDNPAAQPVRDEPVPQRGVDLAEVRFLESCRESRHQIAKQMGVALESIERAEFRAAERARAALETPPAAVPVWVPAHERGDTHAVAR